MSTVICLGKDSPALPHVLDSVAADAIANLSSSTSVRVLVAVQTLPEQDRVDLDAYYRWQQRYRAGGPYFDAGLAKHDALAAWWELACILGYSIVEEHTDAFGTNIIRAVAMRTNCEYRCGVTTQLLRMSCEHFRSTDYAKTTIFMSPPTSLHWNLEQAGFRQGTMPIDGTRYFVRSKP